MGKTECSSIIVGKNVSVTGKVLAGHNEDNRGLLTMPQYYVPGASHDEGDFIEFEKSSAKIPQVKETLGFFWSETRSIDGHSFADGFINDCGVAVFTDGCYASREERPDLKDGGIGYGLRRLIAERATSADDGLEVAIRLIEEYGYNDSGRSYQIVDKDTAWVIQIAYGKNYVARRVRDDEVVFIPNRYTIHQIDFNDRDNFRVSKNLISNAIENGWYKPEKEGDYSDFDFAQNYQRDYADFDARQHVAQWMITGEEPAYGPLPFSVKPNRKIGIDDIKEILRTHYENTRFDASNNYSISPYRTTVRVIDTHHTQCSNIFEFSEDEDFTVIWKSLGRTATSIFNPIFLGSKSVSDRLNYLDYKTSTRTKFNNPEPIELSYDSSLYWWNQMDLQDLVEPQFKYVFPEIRDEIASIEENLKKEVEDLKVKLSNVESVEEFRKISSDFSDKKIEESFNYLVKKSKEIENLEVEVDLDSLKLDGNREVLVRVKSKSIELSEVDLNTIRCGIYFISPYERALPIDSKVLDGCLELRFNEKDLVFGADQTADNLYEFIFWGETKSNKIAIGRLPIKVIR